MRPQKNAETQGVRTTCVPAQTDLTACPACGSGRLICVTGISIDGCTACLRFWERLPPGEPYLRDGEPLPFRTPCDNCAFRGKSPERTDEEKWDDLMLMLAHGGEFYCHKGVPFEYHLGETYEKDFLYPRVTRTATVEGVSHEYQGYDTERMRLCRGFLNRFVPGRQRGESDELMLP